MVLDWTFIFFLMIWLLDQKLWFNCRDFIFYIFLSASNDTCPFHYFFWCKHTFTPTFQHAPYSPPNHHHNTVRNPIAVCAPWPCPCFPGHLSFVCIHMHACLFCPGNSLCLSLWWSIRRHKIITLSTYHSLLHIILIFMNVKRLPLQRNLCN